MKKYYYKYDEFLEDCKNLSKQIKLYNPDTLLAVARGGVTLGHFLANSLDNRRLFTINSIHYDDTKKLDTFDIFNIPNLDDASKVVIIDDIIDSGETMTEIIKVLKTKYQNIDFKVATIFYKPTAIIKADFQVKEATQWIEFFWEIDI
ncbi:MAG: phosphoribosyltransferase family protein [Campylobacterota bacterium]|nr:phosphoribosyltransferase family protein [Campylobacterota bacterium]